MEDDLQSLLERLDKKEEVKEERREANAEIILPEESKGISSPPLNLPDGVDPHKYLKDLEDVTAEVLDACRSDRQEAQDTINIFRKQIIDAIEANRAPARMFIDGLVKAIEVKTNINGTAVKMIETNAKMLAALKVSAGTNVQINNMTGGGSEADNSLERILDEPMSHEDEY